MKLFGKNLIEGGNPKLLIFPVTGGKEFRLTLEYYFGRYGDKAIRKREKLELKILATPKTPAERKTNKDVIELARRIRWEREQEFLQQREGYRLHKDRRINFFSFYDGYIENYKKKDIRMIRIARNRFHDFLSSKHVDPRLLIPEAITHQMMKDFADYLQSRSVGEGAKSILQRFKKVVRACVAQGYIHEDPCKGVSCIVDDQVLKKDVLSTEEIELLISTHYPMESDDIRRAFIFCLYTGMRFCDVKDLKYSSIDYSNKIMRFEQDKTKGHSARSWVTTPLNEGLLSLIGQPPAMGGKEALIFDLGSYESCAKAVKRWVKKAGIDKHITWHCARHSFAVNILNNGANIKTVASLLGHSSLRHTEKYTRAIDKLKEEAINSLPELKL